MSPEADYSVITVAAITFFTFPLPASTRNLIRKSHQNLIQDEFVRSKGQIPKMGKSKRFNLVWEKSSRKKPDIWFQRLRRRITRTIGYTGQGSKDKFLPGSISLPFTLTAASFFVF